MAKCRLHSFLLCLLTVSFLSELAQGTDSGGSAGARGTDLGGGVVTRTNVDGYANLALDVRDIGEALLSGNSHEALSIYQGGRNAELNDVRTGLQSLATTLSTAQTPNVLVQLYGLAERATADLQLHVNDADVFVLQGITNSQPVATKAILVLNMWMYATHLLMDGVYKCYERSHADDPTLIEVGGLDEFIALWIGADQLPASPTSGYGLYALTQQAGDLFDTNSPEALANTNLKILYEEGASALSVPNACEEGTDTPQILWNVAQRMIAQLYVPLLQLLIHAILQQDTQSVHLYANVIVPQASQCRPSVYKRLHQELLGGTINYDRDAQIIRDLQHLYECFGITCEDIGTYQPAPFDDGCPDEHSLFPLAEYQPSSPVHKLARIDLDILQLRILTSLESYDYAWLLYNYGRNAVKMRESENDPYETHSLHEFAISSLREKATPFYNEFLRYHNSPIYGDIAVRQLLLQSDSQSQWSAPEQITETVAGTCAYQIVFLYAIAELHDAVTECRNPLGIGGLNAWDEAAALIIGSLEGANAGGSSDYEDGQLGWNLANRRTHQFQTGNDRNYAQVNSRIESLLFAGKGELDALDCDALERTVDSIQHLMLVPLFQSTLTYAIQSEGMPPDSPARALALANNFAEAILPVLFYYDSESAEIIEENMIIEEGRTPVRDGPQEVADALGSAAIQAGIGCEVLGSAPGADPCKLYGRSSPEEPNPSSSGRQLTFGMAFSVATGLMVGLGLWTL